MALTFREAQEEVDAWISSFREGYFPPLLMLARLAEELGELARVLAHRHGKTPKPGEAEGTSPRSSATSSSSSSPWPTGRGWTSEAAFRRVMAKYRARDRSRWTPKDGG